MNLMKQSLKQRLDVVSDKADNCAASLGFSRSSYAVMVRSLSARISKGLVFFKAKMLLTKFRLAGQTNRTLSNSGFFAPIDAVCKYRRDNQPNDANGNATRRRTGGNGGRIVEPVRELSSLLSQAFVPEYKDDASLRLPLCDGWLRREYRKGERTCDEQSGMSFAFCSGITIGNTNRWIKQ